MRGVAVLCLLALGGPHSVVAAQSSAGRPAPQRATNVTQDPPVLVVGTDLLAEDLIRTCAPEVRAAVAARLANGENEATIRASLATAAATVAASTRTDARDGLDVVKSAIASSVRAEPGFNLGACLSTRRLRQLDGAPLKLALWVGKYNIVKPGPQFTINPTAPRCVALSMSPAQLSDGGHTWRFDVTVRNTCATDQLVVTMRHGSPVDPAAKALARDGRLISDGLQPQYVHDLREDPVDEPWPGWQGDSPQGLSFVPVEQSRARANLMRAGQTVRIPYVYGVKEFEEDFGWFTAFAASCPASSPEGYYQFMFRGPFSAEGKPLAMKCLPNIGAGKRTGR